MPLKIEGLSSPAFLWDSSHPCPHKLPEIFSNVAIAYIYYNFYIQFDSILTILSVNPTQFYIITLLEKNIIHLLFSKYIPNPIFTHSIKSFGRNKMILS